MDWFSRSFTRGIFFHFPIKHESIAWYLVMPSVQRAPPLLNGLVTKLFYRFLERKFERYDDYDDLFFDPMYKKVIGFLDKSFFK